ncbi:MAG: DUF2891 domain-containing protein [bacterium]
MNHLDSFVFAIILLASVMCQQPDSESTGSAEKSAAVVQPANELFTLSPQTASNFARIALNCIQREYPNKPGHVMNDAAEVQNPRTLHPAFYGCYDWHSAVHGHWMLVRLLKRFPDLAEAEEIRSALDQNLSSSNIATEVRYFNQASRKSFERTYGWAWLLKLAVELYSWKDAEGQKWLQNLQPLIQTIVKRYHGFLPKQTYPIRRGVHPNSAFGLAFALDYARTVQDERLATLLSERSLTFFAKDENCPADWEPDGDDFFSPCLMEADLMRRVLQPDKFTEWFERFLPHLKNGEPASLLFPAIVTDRSDPKIVHLDGLNLSRAWCLAGVASALPPNSPTHEVLVNAARRHAETALANVASGHYEGEHWLASFAVYLLSVWSDSSSEKNHH